MSQQPPGRQPLQTYLGSAVRPVAAVGRPVAAPTAAPTAAPASSSTAATIPSPPAAVTRASSLSQQPQPPVAQPLFASTSSSKTSSASVPSSLGQAQLSSLLDTSPASTPRGDIFESSASSKPSPAVAAAPVATPPTPLAPVTRSASTSASPPRPTSLQSSPLGVAPTVRLEQTHEHPLLGPSVSSSPPIQSAVGGAMVNQPPSRGAAYTHGWDQRGTSLNMQGAAPPSATVASSPSPSVVAPAPAPAPAPSPSSSPDDEKLSSLLDKLFHGSIPPAKLAQFDVSKVERSEAGVIALIEKGCWREVIKLCEALLGEDAKTKDKGKEKDTTSATPSSSTLPPHLMYRYLHYYLSALVKLKKFEAAHQVAQQRVGSLWSSDKLYQSHPEHYPPTSAGEQQRVGNMVPFELMMLMLELPHHLPGRRTRHALDQSMKLLSFLKAMIKRKRKEEEAEEGESGGVSTPPQQTRGMQIAVSPPSLSPSHSMEKLSLHEKRPSLVDGLAPSSSTSSSSSSNPFSLHSPHTQSNLTSAQLSAQLATLRMRIANLCLSFASSLELDYAQAEVWLQQLLGDDPHNTELMYALARMHLQWGDVDQAAVYMERANRVHEERGEKEQVQSGIHQALLYLARNDYASAHKQMSLLYAAHPTDVSVVNNYATCCLYVPDGITKGVEALEGLIRADPVRNLQESVLTNLRALYDLSSSHPSLKRRVLEALVIMYGSDDLELGS